MAAGLGFKDFTTGEVLTAADVDGYLMQGVWVFASAAARDAAVTSPQEGNFAYLKDTNVTTYYTGSAWANLDTTGMTNPMTTTGDTIYSSSGSTPARLGIGSTGQVLTVSGGLPVWATPAGGGKVLQVIQGLTNTSTSISSGTFTDTTITATITPTSNTSKILILVTQTIRVNGNSDTYFGAQIDRNGTGIRTFSSNMGYRSPNTNDTTFEWSYNELDAPASTSALTYKIQGKRNDGNGAGIWQIDSQYSSITLLEIGA